MIHNKKSNIYNFTKSELVRKLELYGFKSYLSHQIFNWIYQKNYTDFNKMSNVSKKNIKILEDNFEFEKLTITNLKKSFDDTQKFLVKYLDNKEVEAVYIPEATRATLCVSSQIGCTLSCKFCHTGTQTLVRNLEASEIVAQIILTKDLIDDWDAKNRKLTNLVFMGMGEPFFNYENVAKAIDIICDQDGLAFSRRRITISTSGLVPEILRCSKELKTCLAISLHATNDQLRNEIMGINKKYPLHELFSACKIYNQENPQQKIFFEYVMLNNVNDSEVNARELVALIKKYNINCKVNLIPFNGWEGSGYKNSSRNNIEKFRDILQKNNLITTIRKTRGDDVMGACGQLKSASMREKNHKKT
ncbi:MAG: 23S rRNA (adenine(2503)-C(2))-methyltransferase RlmN [Rickettsiales bacterium]